VQCIRLIIPLFRGGGGQLSRLDAFYIVVGTSIVTGETTTTRTLVTTTNIFSCHSNNQKNRDGKYKLHLGMSAESTTLVNDQ
jgi:hypothetical protein